jgi:hypothetical protein
MDAFIKAACRCALVNLIPRSRPILEGISFCLVGPTGIVLFSPLFKTLRSKQLFQNHKVNIFDFRSNFVRKVCGKVCGNVLWMKALGFLHYWKAHFRKTNKPVFAWSSLSENREISHQWMWQVTNCDLFVFLFIVISDRPFLFPLILFWKRPFFLSTFIPKHSLNPPCHQTLLFRKWPRNQWDPR